MDYTTIRAGDELVVGALTGVRFWTYERPSNRITSFQYHDIDWSPGHAAQSDGVPTIENGRGLNVYKTELNALVRSADAIDDVIRGPDWWIERRSGIVLGEVEFWGQTVEHEFGYRAQYVKPTRFMLAWGYQPEQLLNDLTVLWFGGTHGRDR